MPFRVEYSLTGKEWVPVEIDGVQLTGETRETTMWKYLLEENTIWWPKIRAKYVPRELGDEARPGWRTLVQFCVNEFTP